MTSPPVSGEPAEPDIGFAFPPLEDPPRLSRIRPPSVFTGCVMAWLGGIAGFVIGIFLISITSDSPALQSVAAGDRSDVATSLGVLGTVLVIWCPTVIVMSFLAFRGARWAALVLVGMAAVYLLAALASLVTGAGAQGGLGLVWTVVSAGLLYAPASSRRWFVAMQSE